LPKDDLLNAVVYENDLESENDPDYLELVNVVKKNQRDYVPPIPDFIENDLDDTLRDENIMNIIDQLEKISYEDE